MVQKDIQKKVRLPPYSFPSHLFPDLKATAIKLVL